MRTILARSITTQRRGALSAKKEKVSCGRRGAGTGRQRVLVAQSVEETTSPPDVKVGHQRPRNDGLLKPCDMDVSSAKEEMVRSGARRSAGRGRRRILVSSSFEDTRSPLDIEADHERPHKDRRHGPCETCVSGAKEELGSCARRSAGTGRRIVLVAQSVEDQMGPLNAEIGDERPP